MEVNKLTTVPIGVCAYNMAHNTNHTLDSTFAKRNYSK